jgi:hypothetical protein
MDKKKCPACGVMIGFIRMKIGKDMPVEVDLKRVVLPEGKVVSGYEPHWGNCRKADSFRTTQG